MRRGFLPMLVCTGLPYLSGRSYATVQNSINGFIGVSIMVVMMGCNAE